jgi:flagellar assembly factor FliW
MAESENKLINLRTAQFGEIEFEEKYVFYFEDGILGFEDLRKFVLISDDDTIPFKWMISIEEPNIGFPLLNPWLLDANYSPNKSLSFENEAILVVITLGGEIGSMTANMKAPIIMDLEEQTGRQIILPSDKYSTSHLIRGKNS